MPCLFVWKSNWAIHWVWNIYCYRVNNLTNEKSCLSFDQWEGNGVVFCRTLKGLQFHRLQNRFLIDLFRRIKWKKSDNNKLFFVLYHFVKKTSKWDNLKKKVWLKNCLGLNYNVCKMCVVWHLWLSGLISSHVPSKEMCEQIKMHNLGKLSFSLSVSESIIVKLLSQGKTGYFHHHWKIIPPD